MTTWMVVEDETDLYDFIVAMFDIWGVDGVAFPDGSEAVSWIEAVDKGHISGEMPSLAIIDIRLPGVAGPDVGARLRKSKQLGNMAIVLTTAYLLSDEEERQFIATAQADALIHKPLPEMHVFRQMLEQYVAKRGLAQAAAQ
ncbi:MAG: response regulator [Anaerolineae bacterium]|nr:response regulator [Anaerolineae bacterium]